MPNTLITLIGDGASYHRSLIVTQAAQQLEIQIQRLPSYSPDFMPVEHLWQWLREEVTYHTCYNYKETLISPVNEFQKFVNNQPHQVAARLMTTTSLDLEVERRRFSA